jgi:hypothetical protein
MFEAEEDPLTEDLQTRFRRYKDRVREFVKARASLTMGALEQKKIKLQNERIEILAQQKAALPQELTKRCYWRRWFMQQACKPK